MCYRIVLDSTPEVLSKSEVILWLTVLIFASLISFDIFPHLLEFTFFFYNIANPNKINFLTFRV